MIKSRRMRWVVHVVRMREIRNAYKVLFGMPVAKSLLGILRHRCEDNIKVDLRKIVL
jgi:hypothetical protein